MAASGITKADACQDCVFADRFLRCEFDLFSQYFSHERIPRGCPRGFRRRIAYQAKTEISDLDELVLRVVVKHPGLRVRQIVREILKLPRRMAVSRRHSCLVGCALQRLGRAGAVYWGKSPKHRRWFPTSGTVGREAFENSSGGARRLKRPVGGGAGARESAPVK